MKHDIIYASNCGFGHTGPWSSFRSWGPIVQAVSGLSMSSGLPDQEPAGWGSSYMDHMGGYAMAPAILAAWHHHARTGEGQRVDMVTYEAGMSLLGEAILDVTVNGRPFTRPGQPNGNRAEFDEMAPHDIFPCAGDDRWVAIACEDDDDWWALRASLDEPWAFDSRFEDLAGRLAHADELAGLIAGWTRGRSGEVRAAQLQDAGVPASVVRSPEERSELDPDVTGWGLWPEVEHPEIVERASTAHRCACPGSYRWLIQRRTVQRQTGRHATIVPTQRTQTRCAHGCNVVTGPPARSPENFARRLAWLEDLGLVDEFPDAIFLVLGTQRPNGVRPHEIHTDPEAAAMYQAARDALKLIASRMPGEKFFVEAQRRNLCCRRGPGAR